jgi:hypothetical protein
MEEVDWDEHTSFGVVIRDDRKQGRDPTSMLFSARLVEITMGGLPGVGRRDGGCRRGV